MLVGAGVESVHGIRRAKALGCRVVATDGNARAPGLAEADVGLVASTYDIPATLAVVRDHVRQRGLIDGVLCVAADVPHTVAAVAADLGVRGISPELARESMHKLAMKHRFRAAGLPVPWFAPVAGPADVEELAPGPERPFVIKPVDSRGARGVLLLRGDVTPSAAFEAALAHSPSRQVMVERFVPGPQLSTESLVVDGRAHTVGMSDRNYGLLERYAPHVIEDGGELPTHLPAALRDATADLIQRAVDALGIDHGVVKGDIVLDDGVPTIIELALRLSGGLFCSHEIPLATGVDFLGCAIRQALGERIPAAELTPSFERAVAQRYLFPMPGRVKDVRGVEAVVARAAVAHCEVRVRPGDVITPVHCHPARAGVVITTGPTRAAAVAAAEAAIDTLIVATEAAADQSMSTRVDAMMRRPDAVGK